MEPASDAAGVPAATCRGHRGRRRAWRARARHAVRVRSVFVGRRRGRHLRRGLGAVRAVGNGRRAPAAAAAAGGHGRDDLLAWLPRGRDALAVAFAAHRARRASSGGSPDGPAGYLRDVVDRGLRRRCTCPAGRVRSCCSRPGRRRPPGGHVHRDGGLQRRRRVRGRRRAGPAPDGAADQPEEVLGGLRRLDASPAWSAGALLRDPAAARRLVAGRARSGWPSSSPRRSATSASR